MCINCMCCYAACPQYALDKTFIGPAALALAHRYNLDSRDQGKSDRLDILADHDGVWDCSFVGACSEVCPKSVDPAAAIQQMKVDGAMEFWKQKWFREANHEPPALCQAHFQNHLVHAQRALQGLHAA